MAALLGYGLLWLLPMAVRGSSPPNWPTQARDLYAVTCLFGQGTSA